MRGGNEVVRYDLALFDFDGTLANSFPWFRQTINDLARRFGFKTIEEAEVEQLRGYDARKILAYLGVSTWKIPMIASHLRAQMAKEITAIPLFPGTAEALQRLDQAGVMLGVVSSNAEQTIRQVLGPGLAGVIRHYECGVSLFGKEAKVRTVLRRSGVGARRAIYIGDEIRDIEAARAAGVASGAVAWGYTLPEALREQTPTALFTTLDELVTHVMGGE